MIVYYAVEDQLSEAVAKKLIVSTHFGMDLVLKPLNARFGGSGNIRKNLEKYCELSRRGNVVVLTDLDQSLCAPSLINTWFAGRNIPDGLSFRVSVKEVEAWLLADRVGISNFLGVSNDAIPIDVESLKNPKETLLKITGQSNKRGVKSDLLPQRGRNSTVGLGYNNTLCRFVQNEWNIARAIANSASLEKAYHRIGEIRP